MAAVKILVRSDDPKYQWLKTFFVNLSKYRVLPVLRWQFQRLASFLGGSLWPHSAPITFYKKFSGNFIGREEGTNFRKPISSRCEIDIFKHFYLAIIITHWSPKFTPNVAQKDSQKLSQKFKKADFHQLSLTRPLRRKLRMRWFFDVSKVKESSVLKSDLTDLSSDFWCASLYHILSHMV